MQLTERITTPFVKYTAYGNSFVIVDENVLACLPEREKPLFAERASDMHFGIGSDGLLVIQACRSDVLQKINGAYGYWDTLPASKNCDFVFRLFEANGKEALACGNGLLCVASYLRHRYGIENARVMTEIPLAKPHIITIGTYPQARRSWANLGFPRRVPADIASASGSVRCAEQTALVEGLKIEFRRHDLLPFSDATTLSLSGYLIFTGEPHLVIFPDEQLPPDLAHTLFSWSTGDSQERRRNFGSWLIQHIGNYINRHYRDRFPIGINIDFARVDKTAATVQYRCYERGIYRETLACGTGALAVAHTVKQLRTLTGNKFDLTPHRCTWHQPDARLQVEATADGWLLQGGAALVLEGQCMHGVSQHGLNGKALCPTTKPTVSDWKWNWGNEPQVAIPVGNVSCQN